jgi:LysM repeat protein
LQITQQVRRMRWSKVTALTQLEEGDGAAPDAAQVPIIVLPSPTEYRRSDEAQRSRLGYTIAVLGALMAALLAFWLATRATSLVERLVFGPRPQSRSALTREAPPAAPSAGRPAAAAPSSAPTPAPAATAAPTGTAAPATTAVTTATAAAPVVGTQRPSTTGAATPGPTKPERVHTVQRGDTLYTIAQRNGTTVDALVAANRLGGPSAVLAVGQQITIP